MAKSKLVQANDKIAEKVVGGYKKIEEGVVGGFTQMSDSFVDNFLTKEGESVEEAKARLAAEQKEREVAEAAVKAETVYTGNVAADNMQAAARATAEARRVLQLD